MHELSIALSILDIAAEEAKRHGGDVTAIHLQLGVLSGVVKEALTSSFEMARETSTTPRATLVIEDVPLVAFCATCGGEVTVPSVQELRCPVCGTPLEQIVRGRELDVVAVEIDS